MAAFFSSLNRTLAAGVAILIVVLLLAGAYTGHWIQIGQESWWLFAIRWLHIAAGVMWIGLLWYFNFVQTPSMPKIPDEQKPAVSKVIAPAALYWFRHAAMATIVLGLLLAGMNGYVGKALSLQKEFFAIGLGMWLGIIMWFNVWFVIWPNQKKALGIVTVSPEEKAAAAKLAGMTSRINTMLSIPMLYLMVSRNRTAASERHAQVRLGLLALLGVLSAGSLGAVEFALDEAAYYPEGPTVVNGALYWAEMPAHRIRRHENGNTITMWTKPGCGPTSIKPDARGGFWILCHLAHRVLRVNERFEEVVELEHDGAGHKLTYPNDATSDERGQLYFTSSGRFDLNAPAEGAVFFVDANDKVTRLVSGLRYANGVHLDRKRARLFVTEHLNRRVHVAQVLQPGKIGPLKLFFDLNASPGLRHHEYPLAGPDGMLVRPDGRLLVAEYGASRVLVLSPTGHLQKVIRVPMQFVTNFADWGERGVVVVGAFQNDVMPMPGRVISLPEN